MNKISAYYDLKRLKHCISVAELCYQIADNSAKVSPEDAYMAGLLHDIGKSCEDKKTIMEKFFSRYANLPEFSHHQFVGRYIAENVFGITNKDILEAIEFHATGNSKMSLLAKIVYAADKIDPSRGYNSKVMISKMMSDPEKGFKYVLGENKKYLEQTGKSIDNPLTSKCFKDYLK